MAKKGDLGITVYPEGVTGSGESSFASQLLVQLNKVKANLASKQRPKIGIYLDKSSIPKFESDIKKALKGFKVSIGISGLSTGTSKTSSSKNASVATKDVEKTITSLKKLQSVETAYTRNTQNLSKIRTEANKTEVDELRKNLDLLMNAFRNNPTSKTLDEVSAAFGKVAQKSIEFKNTGEVTRRELKEINDAAKKTKEAFNKLSDRDKKNNQGLFDEYTNALEAFNRAPTKEAAKNLEDIRKKLDEVTTAGNRGAGAFAKLGDKLYSIAKAFVIREISKYVRQMYQEVKLLDSALTQLQIVTGASSERMKVFGQSAADTAKSIGSSISDIVESSTTYARLGYSLDESLDLAKYTAMYSKVANVDVSAATSNITSMVKGFDIATEDLEAALDKMTLVGNNFPISAAELGEGIQNAGSSLQAAGNSLEEAIALLTAAQTTTQDVSKSSTALRTISARIRNSTSELGELNEEMEESYNTTAKYREKLLALTKVDILEADNRTFKSTYEILKQLASVWKELSDIDKASVTTMLAGTRQTNVFSSLMKNWSEAESVMTSLESSAGTLSESYTTYLDSIEGKLGQLKAAYQDLSKTVLDSQLVKGSIERLTTLLEILEKFAGSALGQATIRFIAMKTAISAVSSVVKALKSDGNSLKTIWTGISNLFGKFKKQSDVVVAGANEISEAVENTGKATKSAGISFNGWATLAVIAITTVVSIVEYFQKKAAEARALAIETGEALTEQIQKTSELLESIEKNKKVLEDHNSTYEDAINARKELLQIQDQIIDFYGAEASGINVVSDSLDDLTEKLNKANQSAATRWVDDYYSLAKQARDELTDFDDSNFRVQSLVHSTGNQYLQALYDKVYALKNGDESTPEETLAALESFYEELKKYKDNPDYDIAGQISGVGQTIIKLRDSIKNSDYGKIWEQYKNNIVISEKVATKTADGVEHTYAQIYDKVTSAQNAFNDALISGSEEEAQGLYNKLVDLISDLDFEGEGAGAAKEFYDGLLSGVKSANLDLGIKRAVESGGLTDSLLGAFKNEYGKFDLTKLDAPGFLQYSNSLRKTAADLGTDVETLIDHLIRLGYYENDNVVITDNYSNSIGRLSESYKALSAGIDAAQTAIQEQASNGFMSDEAKKALLDLYPDLEGLGQNVGGQFYIADDAIKEYMSGLYELNRIESIKALSEQYKLLAKAEAEAEAMHSGAIDSYRKQQEQIKDTISAIQRFIYMNQEAAKQFDVFTNASKTDDYAFSNTTVKAIEEIEKGINNLRLGTDDFHEAWSLFFKDGIDNFESDKIPDIISGLNKLKEIIGSEDGSPFYALAKDYGLIVDTIDGEKFAASFSQIKEALADFIAPSPEDAARILDSLSDSVIYPIIEQMESIGGKMDLTNVFSEDERKAYEDWKAGGAKSADELKSAMQNAQSYAEDANDAYEHFLDTVNNSQYDLTGLYNYNTRLQEVEKTLGIIRDLQADVANAPSPAASSSAGTAQKRNNNSSTGMGFIYGYGSADGGIARARGDLVGEEAPEIVVNRKNGTWTLVGQNGAQFVDLKKGDIVFSGAQTKALLKNGSISTRGKTIGGRSFAGKLNLGDGNDYTIKKNNSSTSGNQSYEITVNGNSKMEIERVAEKTKEGTVEGWKLIKSDGIASGDAFSHFLSNAVKDAKPADDSQKPPGGAGGGSSAKEAVENTFEDLIDWIQVRLERLSSKTQRLVNSTIKYIGYKTKNAQLDKALDNIAEEMKAQNKAYEKYTEAANFVGLSDYWKKRVQNGEYDLETITDEDLKKKIDDYQKYYELAEKTKDAVTDLVEQEQKLAKTKFDNIATYYNAILNDVNGQNSLIEKQIELTQESGNLVGVSYYEELIKNSQSNLKTMLAEREALEKSMDSSVLNGSIQEGSDAWYEMLAEINKVDLAIIQANIDAEKYQNSINQIKWDNFSRVNKEYDNLANELKELGEFFSKNVVDDNGEWTAEGITAMSAYAQSMELATYRIDEYNKAIDDLTSDYNKGLYSEIEYSEKLQELREAQWDEVKAHQAAKESIVSLNNTRIDAVKDGIKKELDAYKELINARKSDLDAQKSARDYQNTISEKSKKVTDLQKKLNAMANDDSASAAAKRKKIQEELFEAQEDLENTHYNHSIDTQKQALDDEYKAYEQAQNDKMTALDEYLKNTDQVVADSVTTILGDTSTIFTTYNDLMDKYGIKVSETIVDPWGDPAKAALSTYGLNLDESVSGWETTLNGYSLAVNGANSSFLNGVNDITTGYANLQKQADSTADAVVAATNRMNAATKNPNITASPEDIELATGAGLNSNKNNNKPSGGSSGGSSGSGSSGGSGGGSSRVPAEQKPSTPTPKPAQKPANTPTLDNDTKRKVAAAIVNGTMGWGVDPDRARKLTEVFGANNGIQAIVENVNGWNSLPNPTGYSYLEMRKKFKGYAGGTLGVKYDQFAWLNEHGDELALRANKAGTLSYLTKGTSVVPAQITRNLMELGKYNVASLLSKYSGGLTSYSGAASNPTVFHFDSMLHVDNATSESIPLIEARMRKVIEDYNKQQNYSLKRYTR